jgi:hypothetical protein
MWRVDDIRESYASACCRWKLEVGKSRLDMTWRLGGVDVNAGSHDLLVGDLTPEASMMSPIGYLALQDSREGARHEEHERRRRVRHGNTQVGEGTTTSTSTMTLVSLFQGTHTAHHEKVGVLAQRLSQHF